MFSSNLTVKIGAYLSALAFFISSSLMTYSYFPAYLLWPVGGVALVWLLMLRFMVRWKRSAGMAAAGSPRGMASHNQRLVGVMMIPIFVCMGLPLLAMVFLGPLRI